MASSSPSLWTFWHPRYWLLWCGLALLRLIVLLPQKQRMRAGSLLGKLSYRLAGKRAFIAQRNIELCFPELGAKDHLALTHRHFESLGKSAIEMGMSWWISDAEIERLFVIEGIENMNEAVARGKGVLILCAHLAGVELSGRAIMTQVPPLAAMYRPNNNPMLNALMWRSRAKSISELITKDSIRQLLRALKNKRAVWYAPDQAYTGKNSVLAEFCGIPAMSNAATTQLLKASGATLVPFFPSRLPDDSGYKVQYLPIVEDLPSDDPVADTNAINRILEQHIRKFPEQYYWVHRRFKGRPDSFSDPYATSE